MSKTLRYFARRLFGRLERREGQAMVEYALVLIAIVAVLIAVIRNGISVKASGMYNTFVNKVGEGDTRIQGELTSNPR